MLTEDFVNEVSPPTRGERWVSDTQLKGFGLRMWATKSGGEKVYAIRVRDKQGRPARKSFDLKKNSWLYFRAGFDRTYSIRLGDLLEDARKWARDEIDHLKGQPTIEDEEHERREAAADRVRKITLGQAARYLVSGMRANGLSQAYVDRVDKLFWRYIPRVLQDASLENVSSEAVANAIVDVKIKSGNIRILKSFIGQIYERAASFYGPLGSFSEELSTNFWSTWNERYDVRFPELRDLADADYQRVFKILEAETHAWQQALCIRLYFEFGAPLGALMRAQWRQVVRSRWYPYWPGQRVYWFESRQHIQDEESSLLERVLRLIERDFGASPFWFPSPHGRQPTHIKTVNSVWRDTLHRIGSRYYPLREFARSYREPNNTSYYISFLRQYGPAIRRSQNMAEVSKSLTNAERYANRFS